MELPQLGRHCEQTDCHSLDYLPVICPHCHHTYCGEHRLHHECVYKEEEHNKKNFTIKIDRQCGVEGCYGIDPIVGPVECNHCHSNYCLKHRYPSSHQCPTLIQSDKPERVKKTVVVKSKVTPLTKKVQMMKMKSKAQGNKSIPVTSRIYLSIEHPPLDVYLDKTMTVGRALDTIADICHMVNHNHQVSVDDPQRLVLYKLGQSTPLDTTLKLQDVLEDLDTLSIERQRT